MMNNKFKILTILLVFVCGWLVGSYNKPTPVITSSVGGVSYEGGYQSSDGNGFSAVRKRISQGRVHLIKPGESIQSAVEAANPGDTIQVMPGI